MALFLMARVYPLWIAGTISTIGYAVVGALLLFYVFTIIGGRLYLGMHGFVDCGVGFALGIAMWLIQWAYMPLVEQWLIATGWLGEAVSFRLRRVAHVRIPYSPRDRNGYLPPHGQPTSATGRRLPVL